MPAKSKADLTTENAAVVTGQSTPESITPATLGGALLQDVIDSMWNKTDDVNVSQLNNDANYIASGDAVGGDLGGTLPNPSVEKILGNTIPANAVGVLKNNGAGILSWETSAPANSQSAILNPFAMSGSSAVMMGLAGAITPVKTGTILLMISGEFTSDDDAVNATFTTKMGTGVAPNNGDAITGTTKQVNLRQPSDPADKIPFYFNVVVTLLTPNTTYWIDVAVKNASGGAVQLYNVSISAIEQ